jgi:hypothetical protein
MSLTFENQELKLESHDGMLSFEIESKVEFK